MTLTLKDLLSANDFQTKVEALEDGALVTLCKEAFSAKNIDLQMIQNFANYVADTEEKTEIKNTRRDLLKKKLSQYIKAKRPQSIDDDNEAAVEKSEADKILEIYDAAIEKINDGMFDISEINKLLHLNFFEVSEVKDHENNDAVITNHKAHTFIAYALPSLRYPVEFIEKLVNFLGKEFLKNYLKTLNMNGNGDTKLGIIEFIHKERPRIVRIVNGQVEVIDLGFWGENPALLKNIEDLIYTSQQEKPLLRLVRDTHDASVHKSADVSHVTGFQLLVNSKDSPLKGIKVEYTNPVEARERKEFNIYDVEEHNEKDILTEEPQNMEFKFSKIEEIEDSVLDLKLDESTLKEVCSPASVEDSKDPVIELELDESTLKEVCSPASVEDSKNPVLDLKLDDSKLKEVCTPSSAEDSKETWVAHRKVNITDTAENKRILSDFCKSEIDKLKVELSDILKMDNKDLYSKFGSKLFPTTKLKDTDLLKEFEKLSKEQMEVVNKKITGLKFKTAAALRLLAKESHLSYTLADACGLSIATILATIYWSSKDVKNFCVGATVEGNLLSLINQMHDSVRGYNIDDGIDDPDTDTFPTNPGYDQSRCIAGTINSLAQALHDLHKAYYVRSVSKEDLQNKVKLAFRKIVNSPEFIEEVKNTATLHSSLLAWASTGIIPNAILALVENTFNKKYKDQIDDEFLGDLTEDNLAHAKTQAKQVLMPKEFTELSQSQERRYECVSDLCNAITSATLPLLRLDGKSGYNSPYEADYSSPNDFSLNQLRSSGSINLAILSRYTRAGSEVTLLDHVSDSGYDLPLADLEKLSVKDYKFYANNRDTINNFFRTGKLTDEFSTILTQIREQNHPTLFELLVTRKFKNGSYAVVDAYKKTLGNKAYTALINFTIRHDLHKVLSVILEQFNSKDRSPIFNDGSILSEQQCAEKNAAYKCYAVLVEKHIVNDRHTPTCALPISVLKSLLKNITRAMHDAVLEDQFIKKICKPNICLTDVKALIELSKGTQVSLSIVLGTFCEKATVNQGHKAKIVEAIVEGGADVHYTSRDYSTLGYNALHFECSHAPNVEVINLLVKKSRDQGAYVNSKTNDGHTPIDLVSASANASPAVINRLVELGAEVTSNSLTSAVECAKPNLGIISLLIEKGAEVTQGSLEYAAIRSTIDTDIFSTLLTAAKAQGLKVNLGPLLTNALECPAMDCATRKVRALLNSELPKEGELNVETSNAIKAALDKLFLSRTGIDKDIAILRVLLEYPQVKKLFGKQTLDNLFKLDQNYVRTPLELFVDSGVYVDSDTLGRALLLPALESAALKIMEKLHDLDCSAFLLDSIKKNRFNLVSACLNLPKFQTAVTAAHVLAAAKAENTVSDLARSGVVHYCRAVTDAEAKEILDFVCTSKANMEEFIMALLTSPTAEVFKKAVTSAHVTDAIKSGKSINVIKNLFNANITKDEDIKSIFDTACSSDLNHMDNFITYILRSTSEFEMKVKPAHFVAALNKGRTPATLTSLLANVSIGEKFSQDQVTEILTTVCATNVRGMDGLLNNLLERKEFKAEIKKPKSSIVETAFKFYTNSLGSFQSPDRNLTALFSQISSQRERGGRPVIDSIVINLLDNGANPNTNGLLDELLKKAALATGGNIPSANVITKLLEKGATFTEATVEKIANKVIHSREEWRVHHAFFKRLAAQENLTAEELVHLCNIEKKLSAPAYRPALSPEVLAIRPAMLSVLAKRPTPIHFLIHTNIYATEEKKELIEDLVTQRFIVKINAIDSLGRTPLDLALSYKDFDIADKLIELGASVSFANRYTMFKHNYGDKFYNPFNAFEFKTVIGLAGIGMVLGAGLYSSETFQKNCVPVIKPIIEPIANKIIDTLLAVATKCKAAIIA